MRGGEEEGEKEETKETGCRDHVIFCTDCGIIIVGFEGHPRCKVECAPCNLEKNEDYYDREDLEIYKKKLEESRILHGREDYYDKEDMEIWEQILRGSVQRYGKYYHYDKEDLEI